MYEVADHIDCTAAPSYGRPSLVGDLTAQAELFAQAVEPLKLAGMVAKRRVSTYTPGVQSPDWIKIKRKGWQDGRVWRK